MDEESLSRICISAFSDSDILEAKNLLFGAITTTSKRNITRKKDGKKLREIEDIISLLQVTHPNDRPVFVAKDLQKLPPVLFDHVDVTKLLKDLTRMRSEMEEIKSQYVSVSQFETIKRDIADLKKAKSPCYSYVNTKRRGGTHMMDSCDYDSGPMGLQHLPVVHKSTSDQTLITQTEPISPPTHYSSILIDQNIHSTKSMNELNRKLNRKECKTGLGSHLCIDNNTEQAEVSQKKDNNNIARHPGHTAAEIAQSTSEPQATKTFARIVSEGEWTLVQKPKKKMINRFVGNIGKAVIEPNHKFKATNEKNCLIYLSCG